MIKHTQTIRQTNHLSVVDYFVGLALKGLINTFQPNMPFLYPMKISETLMKRREPLFKSNS